MAIKLIKGKPEGEVKEGEAYVYLEGNTCILKSYKGQYAPVHSLFYDKFYFCKVVSNFPIDRTSLISKEGRDCIMKKLGCSPSTLHRVYRSMVSELLMNDLHPYIRQLCLTRRGYIRKGIFKLRYQWDFAKIQRLRISLDKIKQLDEDGLMHLAPFVMHFNQSPQCLKERFGSAWKQIAHNSFSRNLLIINTNASDAIALLHIPTTVLKKGCHLNPNSRMEPSLIKKMFYLYKKSRRLYKDFSDREFILFHDMIRLAIRLQRHPSPKTWEDVQRLHDRYVVEQLEKESAPKSDAPITYVLEPWTEKLFGTNREYRCTPLVSDRDLYLEGKKMHHCIYSYLNKVQERTYYVIHVENIKTLEQSTLGFSINSSNGTIGKQHLGVQNSKTNNDEITRQVFQYITKQNLIEGLTGDSYVNDNNHQHIGNYRGI